MNKNEPTSTKLRNDITTLLKAIRPQYIRESVLTKLLQQIIDPIDNKPQYTIGNIRAVYNSYAGRSGSVPIPHVQGVKIGNSNYYTYSRFEETEPKSLQIDNEVIDNNSFLFLKKDTNIFRFFEGATEKNKQLIEKFNISHYSFFNTEENEMEVEQNRNLMRVLVVQQLLEEIFLHQKEKFIDTEVFIQTLHDFLYKHDPHLFQDKFIDEDDYDDDAQLELENIKECMDLVISLDFNYQYNENKTIIINSYSYTPTEENISEIDLLDRKLRECLIDIKKLQAEALENFDIDLIMQLNRYKEVEQALMSLYFESFNKN